MLCPDLLGAYMECTANVVNANDAYILLRTSVVTINNTFLNSSDNLLLYSPDNHRCQLEKRETSDPNTLVSCSKSVRQTVNSQILLSIQSLPLTTSPACHNTLSKHQVKQCKLPI